MEQTFQTLTTIATYISLGLTLILAISEIRKRRAEVKNIDVNSDTHIMTEIKQASLDLFKELKAENAELKTEIEQRDVKIDALEQENKHLREVILDLEVRLQKCERQFKIK